MYSFNDALANLKDVWNNMDIVQQVYSCEALAGKRRGYEIASALDSITSDDLDRYCDTICASTKSYDDATKSMEEFSNNLSQLGISVVDLTDSISKIGTINSKLDCLESMPSIVTINCEMDVIKDKITDLENQINELRSALAAMTEKPKQKSDLDFFNQIVPNYDFTILNKGNIFLD